MILAAGRGNRLRPETDTLPKPLFKIGNTNMIRNALGYLLASGITDIAVNLHHLGKLIEKELSWNVRDRINLHLVHEEIMMGTAGGIKGAEDFLSGSTFAVINSDILTDINLEEAIAIHRSNNALATLVVRDNPQPSSISTLSAHTDGRLARFIDTKAPCYNLENLDPVLKMFTGVAVYSPEIFKHIPGGRPCDISTEVFPKLIEADLPVYTYNHKGYWADIGTHQSFTAARMDVALGKFKTFPIQDTHKE
ncbi:MAG: nucleotidyltransferase family protein [Nitrospinota bacterium]|nr:nucleotidyltransferase family protein [Nitrospinota bacterium]